MHLTPGSGPVAEQRLAFLRGSQLIVQAWRVEGDRFETGPEHVLANLPYGSGWLFGAPVDSTADDRLLTLVRTDAAAPPRIQVVLGWDRELSRPSAPSRPDAPHAFGIGHRCSASRHPRVGMSRRD